MGDHELGVLTALGTVGAVAVALLIAIVQAGVAIVNLVNSRRRARKKVASLVSAWIEYGYTQSGNGIYYRRTASLHIANESDEPVYRLEAICGIDTGSGVIQMGPLAAPSIIPTLPPKQRFSYDITSGILSFGDFAHSAFNGLVARITFNDHEGKKWEREFDGKLTRLKHPRGPAPRDTDDELVVAQAGPIENPYNPLQTLFVFAEWANSKELSDEDFHGRLISEAEGWSPLSGDEVEQVRTLFREADIASHVWYPTPRIAYVRLLLAPRSEDQSQTMQMVTLVWRRERGWTLFGLGAFQPWTIAFDPGEIETDPLDER